MWNEFLGKRNSGSTRVKFDFSNLTVMRFGMTQWILKQSFSQDAFNSGNPKSHNVTHILQKVRWKILPKCLARKGQIQVFFMVTWLNTYVNMRVKFSYHDTAKCSKCTPLISILSSKNINNNQVGNIFVCHWSPCLSSWQQKLRQTTAKPPVSLA